MDFTFGIITSERSCWFLNEIIDSIEVQNIENYEIIIVGNVNIDRINTTVFTFNENIYPDWTTKKKNIITNNAKYENIVYMHDYVKLHNDWYSGFLKFGNNFQVLSNIILDKNSQRFRDWVLNVHFTYGLTLKNGERNQPIPYVDDVWEDTGLKQKLDIANLNIDYDANVEALQEYIYISGTYWVCKKYIMQEFPLNENLLHYQGDDVEWTQRVSTKYKFSFNKYSTVLLLKHK